MILRLFAVIPLTCLITVPLAWRWCRPSVRLRRLLVTPVRAGLALLAANLLVLLLVAAFLLAQSGTLPALIAGPALSIVAWTCIAKSLPLDSAGRWVAALLGMSPYILLVARLAVWVFLLDWMSGGDPFMAWVGAVLWGAVSLGAAVLGTLITVRVRG